jgi:flavin-dependent dehydrogenase
VLLRRAGLLERFCADGHAPRGAAVSVWDVEAPAWFDTLRDPNGPGWHLDRPRFDALLRRSSAEAGAKIACVGGRLSAAHDGTMWRVRLDGTERVHTAPVLVDATGRGAALCRSLGVRARANDRLICAYALLAHVADDVDRCTRIAAEAQGWWYSVRVPSGGRVLAFHADAGDPALRALRDPTAFLARARRLPVLAEILARHAPAPVRLRPAGSRALDLDACANRPGLYAIGDAVLAFDPLSSQGLFHALASADSAANAIDGGEGGRIGYFEEMRRVAERYRAHLAATYAGPSRRRPPQPD